MSQLDCTQANKEIRSLYAGECQSCGLCCIFYASRTFCMPIAADGIQPPKRLIQIGPSLQKKHPHVSDTTKYLRIVKDRIWEGHSRCAALVGVQHESIRCGIYESRPTACREFDPGSPECLRIRNWGYAEPVYDFYSVS
jgi:Fe-S-cluster containining protein